MTMEKDSREPDPADRSATFKADVSGPPMWVALIFFALIVLWLWQQTQQY